MTEPETNVNGVFKPTLLAAEERGLILRIYKGLAAEIGLSESMVLLQLEHLIGISTTEPKEERAWTYQSIRKLQREFFPSWHASTVNKNINRLRDNELIEVENYNRFSFDRTRWITLNCDRLRELDSVADIEFERKKGKPVPQIVIPNREEDGPLRVYPCLAGDIGLNEAIVLLQLDYLISIAKRNYVNGRSWTRQSTQNLLEESFPWWSESTINRTIKKLKRKGLIIIERHPTRAYDHRRSFALDYETLCRLDAIKVAIENIPSAQNTTGVKQNATRTSHSETHSPQAATDSAQVSTTIPETPTETLTENPKETSPHTPRQAAMRPDGKVEKREENSNSRSSEQHGRTGSALNTHSNESVPTKNPSSPLVGDQGSRKDLMAPKTPFQKAFLETLEYRRFERGIKPSVNAIAEAIEEGNECPFDTVYVKCKQALLACDGKHLPINDLPPLPESWWYFKMGHAKEYPWTQQTFVSALLNRDNLLKHCNYMIHRLELEDPATERVASPSVLEEEEEYDQRLRAWEDDSDDVCPFETPKVSRKPSREEFVF